MIEQCQVNFEIHIKLALMNTRHIFAGNVLNICTNFLL
jgi:hypothetical protein